MSFAPYTPVYGCGNDGPGAKNLLYWFDQESPWRGTCYNLGVCACRGTGSGATSQHARCRAGDIGIPMLAGGRPNLAVGNAVVMALAANAGRLGVSEIIWNRRRWSARYPQGAAYGGVSPHYDHVHYALSLNATRLLNVPTIRAVMAGTVAPPPPPAPNTPPAPQPAPPQEDDDMAVMVRLNAPGHKHHGRIESVTAMNRRWVPSGAEVNLHRFLGGAYVDCNLADFNTWVSNKEPVGTNQLTGPM